MKQASARHPLLGHQAYQELRQVSNGLTFYMLKRRAISSSRAFFSTAPMDVAADVLDWYEEHRLASLAE
jgi:hypothetical protein